MEAVRVVTVKANDGSIALIAERGHADSTLALEQWSDRLLELLLHDDGDAITPHRFSMRLRVSLEHSDVVCLQLDSVLLGTRLVGHGQRTWLGSFRLIIRHVK